MGRTRTNIVTKDTPTVKFDRKKLSEYCAVIGHSETSLSTAFSNSSYISHRFLLYDGQMPASFVDWCNRMYPRGKEALMAAIIPDAPKPEPPAPPKVEEQMQMALPSVTSGKVVTIQPVSVVGFNQVVDALHEIAKRLEALERAWSGGRDEGGGE